MIEDVLEEELQAEFTGATLSINPDEVPKPNKSDWNTTNLITPFTSIPHKISATLWSKPEKAASVTPTKENSIQQSLAITENPNNFFTFRESVLAKALEECKQQFLDEDSDGPLTNAFLLTQISHWNSDKERLVLLTPKSLVICKYDFIALKRLEYKKIPLEMIEEITVGELVYPSASLVPNRNMKGVRLSWNNNRLNAISEWNPFNQQVPYITFTFHPLFFHKDCNDEKIKQLYSLDKFVDNLTNVISELERSKNGVCNIQEGDILLKSYVGLGSLIHNRNALGFFKVRGRFSF